MNFNTTLAGGHADPDDCVVQIVQTSNGQGMRYMTGHKVVGSSALVLRKAGGGCFTEAGLELIVAKHFEFTTDIVRVKSQPCRVDLMISGSPKAYFPDFALLHDDGSREIVEVKPDWTHLDDPEYARKLELSQEAFEAKGWRFRTLVLAHILPSTGPEKRVKQIIDDNIRLMYVSNMTHVTERQKANVGKLLRAEGGVTTLGKICEAIGGFESAAMARAYSLMSQRLIEIDLTRVLSPSNKVRSVSALPAFLPALRF